MTSTKHVSHAPTSQYYKTKTKGESGFITVFISPPMSHTGVSGSWKWPEWKFSSRFEPSGKICRKQKKNVEKKNEQSVTCYSSSLSYYLSSERIKTISKSGSRARSMHKWVQIFPNWGARICAQDPAELKLLREVLHHINLKHNEVLTSGLDWWI